jgi:tetratricopeptide (TPR) repeat protein
MPTISYKTLFTRAEEAGTKRDYAQAEELLTRIVAETDTMPTAWLFLGRARHALGDHDRAIAAFAAYLGYQPDDAAGWFFMGRTYLALGRAREAASCLRTATATGKSSAEAFALLGFAELRLKHSGKAVEYLERAVSLDQDNRRIFNAYLNALSVHAIRILSHGQFHEAAAMLEFVIRNGLNSTVQRLYRARALRADDRLEEAITELDAAMQSAPDDASLLLQMASLKFAVGDTAGAMSDIQRSGAALPGSGKAWTEGAINRWRALVALQQGDARAALQAALDLIRNGDSDAAIRAVAAQANFELKRFERAAEHYNRAVEADPASPDLRSGLALSLWELGDYQGARSAARGAAARGASPDDLSYIEILCDAKTGSDPVALLAKTQAMIRIRPGDPRLMMVLAESLYKTGRPDLADGWFADLLKVWPDHELARLYRISTAESIGDDETALIRYADYLGAYPDNSSIRKDYVTLLVKLKRWQEAASAIEEGYSSGASRGSDSILALCYRNAGRHREAAALYRKLLRDKPRDVDLLLGLAYSLVKSGAKAVAIELLERGAAFMVREPEPYLALGVLLARGGNLEKAVASFLRASELAPADPRPLRHLARLYEKSGMREMAGRFDERAAALETDTPRTSRARK